MSAILLTWTVVFWWVWIPLNLIVDMDWHNPILAPVLIGLLWWGYGSVVVAGVFIGWRLRR